MFGLIHFAEGGGGPSTALSSYPDLVLKNCTFRAVFFFCILLNLGTDLTEDCDIFEHLEKLAGFIRNCP